MVSLSLWCEAFIWHTSRHQRPTGVEFILSNVQLHQLAKMQNWDIPECSASPTLSEVAMLDHDLRGQTKCIRRASSSSRHNSEQQVKKRKRKKSKHKVVSGIVSYHPGFWNHTWFPLKRALPSLWGSECSISFTHTSEMKSLPQPADASCKCFTFLKC